MIASAPPPNSQPRQTLFEKGELGEALRGYQRSHFWDPTAREPLKKIIPLAFSLERVEVAVRYALRASDLVDARLLRRLALYQTEQREWADALRLLRLWLDADVDAGEASPGDPARDDETARLMVRFEIARLEYLTGDVAAASRSFEQVQQTLMLVRKSKEKSNLEEALGADEPDFWETLGRTHWEAGPSEARRRGFRAAGRLPQRLLTIRVLARPTRGQRSPFPSVRAPQTQPRRRRPRAWGRAVPVAADSPSPG